MSFIAPLVGRMAGANIGAGAAEAATAGRSAAFTSGMRGVSPGGVLGFDGDMPVIGPAKSEIDDVEGTARRTPNPNSVIH